VSNRDNRDFRPSRRRDFVDDDYQPPSRDFGYGPPRGAQFDVPSGPPVQAIVKWYNPIKGFGFVELGDGSGDAFLHVSIVERAGEETIPPGATLEVRAGPGQRGLQITEIITVDTSTASQAGPRRRPDDRATVEETGTVKWYNATKGFGFVAPDRGGKDIFTHATALQRAGIVGLAQGQRVAVDVTDGQKGPEAVSVRLI
jgi:CspA family cold shock protein